MANQHHLKPSNSLLKYDVKPADVGWDYLGYQVVKLYKGENYTFETEGNEAALVPLMGKARLSVDGQSFEVERSSVFKEKPHILYAPPGKAIEVDAQSEFEFAIGTAPAEGKYSVRLFKPSEMRTEVRGGGRSHRALCVARCRRRLFRGARRAVPHARSVSLIAD